MSQPEKQLWEDLSNAFVEADTRNPLHSLLTIRAFETKILRGYCNELDIPQDALDSALDNLVVLMDEEYGLSSESAVVVSDLVSDFYENQADNTGKENS